MRDGALVGGGRRAAAVDALVLAVLLAGAALLLHVPRARVPLVYDMVGYAAQAHGLLNGHGNTVALADEHLPGIYPAGVPVLAAAAMALLGPDLRHGVWAILACALLSLACAYLALRRTALPPWAAAAAALAVLCSPLFRDHSGYLMSQVPTAAAVALALLLFVSRRSGVALLLAGLVAMLSLLLRYANVSFPAALVAAELLCGGLRARPRMRSLLWLGAGLAAGGAAVLAHNALLYGSPTATGYSLWGWDVEGQFSWRHVVQAPGTVNFQGDHILLRAFAGLGELHSVPMVAAAALGLALCWRDGRGSAARAAVPEAWRLGAAAACTVGASYLLLAGYSFRSESYLVPTVPAIALLAAYGGARGLELLGGPRAGPRLVPLAPVLAAGLLVLSVARAPPPTQAVEQALVRHASLERAGLDLPRDAALITTADPGLVEPLFRYGTARDVLYLGPFVSALIEERALAEAGTDRLQPRHVVAWALQHLRAGRAVFLDQNPPPRGLTALHVAVRTTLLATFTLAPTDVANLFRLARRDAPRPR